MCEFLKTLIKKITKPASVEIERPKRIAQKQIGLVALVVGHNSKDQGAINYLKESEWVFSSRILRKVQQKLKDAGYSSVIVFRPPVSKYYAQVNAVVKQCKELKVTHAILSHFNSAGAGARGCEFMIPMSGTSIDNKMADMGTDLLNERLGIKERRDDGVYEVPIKHRGSGMMYGLLKAGIYNTLAEPCFANFKTKESSAIFDNEDAYVDILKDLAEACSNGTIDKYTVGK